MDARQRAWWSNERERFWGRLPVGTMIPGAGLGPQRDLECRCRGLDLLASHHGRSVISRPDQTNRLASRALVRRENLEINPTSAPLPLNPK